MGGYPFKAGDAVEVVRRSISGNLGIGQVATVMHSNSLKHGSVQIQELKNVESIG